jgi:hypothetical protein
VISAAGKTMAENLAELPALKEGQQVIMPIDQPIKSSGHIQVRLMILISSCYYVLVYVQASTCKRAVRLQRTSPHLHLVLPCPVAPGAAAVHDPEGTDAQSAHAAISS